MLLSVQAKISKVLARIPRFLRQQVPYFKVSAATHSTAMDARLPDCHIARLPGHLFIPMQCSVVYPSVPKLLSQNIAIALE